MEENDNSDGRYLVEMRNNSRSDSWITHWGFEHEREAKLFVGLKNRTYGWEKYRIKP